ncbi:MAG: 7TM diverse intracellular signaling domain-containing protein [Flavicella sp.]
MNRFLLLLFISFLLSSCSDSTDTTTAYTETNTSLVKTIHYVRDNSYNLEKLHQVHMEPLSNNKFVGKNGEFWFRVQLKEERHPQRLMFNVQEPSICQFEIYDQFCLLGSKENSVGLSSIAVPIKVSESNLFFIKVNFCKQVNFPLTVERIEKYYRGKQIEFIKGSWYYGFLLMVLILNLFFYISTKDITHLFYCFLATVANVVISYYDGYAYYFFPRWFHFYGEVFTHLLIVPFSGLMALKFLNVFTKNNLKTLLVLTLIECLFYTVFIITNNFLFFKIGDVLTLLIVGYYFSFPIRMFKDSTYAKLFFFGYSLLFISAVLYMVPLDFGIHLFDISINFMKAGSLVENLILTYAISFRVKQMNIENISYQSSIKSYVEALSQFREGVKGNSLNKDLPLSSKINFEIENLAKTYELTNRELEVFRHIVRGQSNRNISMLLSITVHTVKFHTRNIYQKLDINKREDISILLKQ